MTWLNFFILAATLTSQENTAYKWNEQVTKLLAEGKNLEAVAAGRQAVASAETVFGPQHPATAMMIRNLAVAYERSGEYSKAEASANRALSILAGLFGANDVSLTPVLNVLVETYAAQGRYLDAEKLGRRAVAIGSGAGLHYATALQNVGAVLEAEGDRAAARQFYARALAARKAMLPAGHPYIEQTQAALVRVGRKPAKLVEVKDAAFAR